MTWVIEYDCGECVIVTAETREECWSILDDLGCHPIAVYSPREVILTTDPWTKNGQLRCSIAKVLKV